MQSSPYAAELDMIKPTSTSPVRVMRSWRSVHRRTLAIWLIAGCVTTFWQTGSTQGQESAAAFQVPAKKHLGNGLVDMNNLSSDILNCDVCRQRLGLPPLQRSNVTPANVFSQKATPQPGLDLTSAAPVRMLGSPGLITSGTASQMATEGLVVEEFKPAMPEAGTINLGGLPLEVRQQFMRGLELPAGATIMSAQISSENQKLTSELPKPSEEKKAVADPVPALPMPPPTLPGKPQGSESTKPETLGAPGLGSAPEDSHFEPSPTVESTDSLAAAREMAESMAKVRAQADEQILKIEASKREIAKMLEKRTNEVSELQAVLKERERELAQAKASAKKKSPKKNQDHRKNPKSDSAKDL